MQGLRLFRSAFLICRLQARERLRACRELLQERIRSGIAAAKARGKRLGRQPGQRPKSDRFTPKVLALVADGRSYRLIARELGLSKNTVLEIVKRNRAMSA